MPASMRLGHLAGPFTLSAWLRARESGADGVSGFGTGGKPSISQHGTQPASAVTVALFANGTHLELASHVPQPQVCYTMLVLARPARIQGLGTQGAAFASPSAQTALDVPVWPLTPVPCVH